MQIIMVNKIRGGEKSHYGKVLSMLTNDFILLLRGVPEGRGVSDNANEYVPNALSKGDLCAY